MCPLAQAGGVKLQGKSQEPGCSIEGGIGASAAAAPINTALFVCVHASVKLHVVSPSVSLWRPGS